MSTSVIDLTKRLCEKRSITPHDEGCQTLLSDRLSSRGFRCRPVNFNDVSHLWAVHGEEKPPEELPKPVLLFLGHTDVVPEGDLSLWQTPPFQPTIREENLIARGVADMKGSIAAFCCAAESYVQANPKHKGSLIIMLTSDEEGSGVDGIRRMAQDFIVPNNVQIDYCLVGEPSSEVQLGDTLKYGRRGSLNVKLRIMGTQMHVARADHKLNSIHRSLPILQALQAIQWNIEHDFPPTALQFSNIHGGVGVHNVTPSHTSVDFNFRYGTANDADHIKKTVTEVVESFGIDHELSWEHSAEPYLSNQNGQFAENVIQSIEEVCGISPVMATSGGTSDGRFIAPLCSQVLEFGPISKTIHQVNERVAVKDLECLQEVYRRIIEKTFA